MAKIIEFPAAVPAPDPAEAPNYSGHILMLNLKKASRFQTFNFLLGTRNKTGVVPEHTDHGRIGQAIQAEILFDLTDHPELFVPDKPVADVTETDTGKKVYSGTVEFFRQLGITDDAGGEDEVVAYATADPVLQQQIEKALATAPVSQPAPLTMEEAKRRASRSLIELPPGFDNPERYLIR